MLQMFPENGLAPYGNCLLWQPGLIWLHASSDIALGLAYYAIPVALGFLVVSHRDLALGRTFWLFALSILACGTTHFMEVWVLWHPDYLLQGLLKAFTAMTSVLAAVLLCFLMPRLRVLPTPGQFRRINAPLTDQSLPHGRTLEQFRHSEEGFRVLIESIPDCAMFTLDRVGQVTSWNAGAEHVLGYGAEDIIGRQFACFYTLEGQSAGEPTRELEIAKRQGRFQPDTWRVRKDGSRFMADALISPVLDREGVAIGYAAVTRDVTERRHAQAALEQAQAELAQSQKMEAVGQLTGGVAHDFNNMLTAILGSLELLDARRETFSHAARDILMVIRQAVEHGAELTRRLLAFSRKQTLAPAVTDVNRLLSNLSELLRRTLGQSVTVDTVLAADLWPVSIDRNQLESAMLNLTVNARDAMQAGGCLTIQTANTFLDENYARRHQEVTLGDYVAIAVSDTGLGMSRSVLARAFEPFFSTKDVGKGTGLGLSQVYGFVKQSGGHIDLHSEVGQGTTVKLYLPRHYTATEATVSVPGEPAPTLPGGHETILVVEDDDNVRGFSVSAVRHLGYNVLDAGSAGAAITIVKSHPHIRLLFTDVGLPGMDGRQLADEARTHLPGLKVVYTSGYARTGAGPQVLTERGMHLLPKPFRIESLAQMLRSVLDET